MSLKVERCGTGEPLVLLHGWGLHSLVWDCTAPPLARAYTVIRIDRLIFVSTTPRFTRRADERDGDWPHGLARPAVERFAALLESDYEATVRETGS
jgi:pimeloyl-ACP methyl ester carboxylesterase